MDKQEALAVMHEILDVLKESVLITRVSLDGRRSHVFKDDENGDYSIRIRCDFEAGCWNGVKPILERHGLSMKVADGFVVISKTYP